jgi:hypothetical protein
VGQQGACENVTVEQEILFLPVLPAVLHVPREFFQLLPLLQFEQLRLRLLQLRLLQLVQKGGEATMLPKVKPLGRGAVALLIQAVQSPLPFRHITFR